MTKLLESWDRNKAWIYFAVSFVWVLSLISSLIIYNSPPNQFFASTGAYIVVGISIVFVGLIELDLITDALGIANTPRRMIEKLLTTYPDVERARARGEWWHSPRLRKALVEDQYHELEKYWWSKRSYIPIKRIVIVLGKVVIVTSFFSFVSLCLAYLLKFESFYGLTPQSSMIEHFYTASQAIFLIGYDEVRPLHDWTRIISMLEFLVGFVSLAVGVDRLVEPPDEELKRHRQAMDRYFR